MFRILSCLVTVALTGCASAPHTTVLASKPGLVGVVSSAPIAASPQEQYESKPNVRFEQPAPFPENSSPVYPEQLLANRLPPFRLNVRVVANDQGQVLSVSPLDPVPAEREPFFASVQAALLTWQFLPLVQITDGPGTSEISIHDTTSQYQGQAKALAFHQDYGFVFQQQNGKGTVSAEKSPQP
jgi:hypothetical protein